MGLVVYSKNLLLKCISIVGETLNGVEEEFGDNYITETGSLCNVIYLFSHVVCDHHPKK